MSSQNVMLVVVSFENLTIGGPNIRHQQENIWMWITEKHPQRVPKFLGNQHLIHLELQYQSNKESINHLREIICANLESTRIYLHDRNGHPITIIMGAPGVGKMRFLIELEYLMDIAVTAMVVSFNIRNMLSDIDTELGTKRSLCLHLLYAVFMDSGLQFWMVYKDFINVFGSAKALSLIETVTMCC